VDNVITYLHHDIEECALMYIVYAYFDYRKENSVIFHATFDDEEEAIESWEVERKVPLNIHVKVESYSINMRRTDQEGLWRIAVDYVIFE
jgi:hypothetical protein